jgi:dTDP-4-dehydrorhamnose 3,5-epimerase
MSFRNVPTHVDDRGVVFEMFDTRWNWHPDPVVFSYCYTVRPGIIKGWGVHRKHEDRYFLLFGELELVLYDERPDSSTLGLVSKIYLNHYQRRIINIPAGVWHANRNVGLTDAVVVNFPTIPYDHADPDKFRLPLDTDRIPYTFDNPKGG